MLTVDIFGDDEFIIYVLPSSFHYNYSLILAPAQFGYVIIKRKENQMVRIDDAFMEEVGLSAMPEAEKRAFMEHAEQELEVRVGQQIGAGLPEEKLDEFERIEDVNLAAQWLQENVPNYREIVTEVFRAFKEEIQAESQNILGY